MTHEIVMDVNEWDCQDCWEAGTSATCPVLAAMPPATAEDLAEWYGGRMEMAGQLPLWEDEPQDAPQTPCKALQSGLETRVGVLYGGW